jgi:hypothetical protein
MWETPLVFCQLCCVGLRLLKLPFRATLEASQGIFNTGGELFRAKCFEDPTPPAWWEDEVSAILDATGGRINGTAEDVWLHLYAQWEKSMQAKLVPFGIDVFHLEGEVQDTAKRFSCEVDGLPHGGWTWRLTTF